jgi:hypothetical protein
MTQSVLLGFGDSWAWGSGLDTVKNGEPYIKLLAKKLNISCDNRACPSTGVPHLIIQLTNFIKTKQYSKDYQYTAVFFISAMERDILIDDNGTVMEMQPLDEKFADYYKKIYTDNLASFRLNTNLLTLQKLCEYHDINDYYIFGWQTPTMWPEINLNKFYKQGTHSVCDVFLEDDTEAKERNRRDIDYLKHWKQNPYMFPTVGRWSGGGHPNQLGHEKIAEILENWIKLE